MHNLKIKTNMKNFFIFLTFVLIQNKSYAALNGAYTINPLLPASATNYNSFVSAARDLRVGVRTDGGPVNGPNVTGPVTFTAASGVYLGKVLFTTIGGSSATNKITFKSATNTAASVTIQDSAKTVAENGVVHIQGAQHIYFEAITIKSLYLTGTSFGTYKNNDIVIENNGAISSSNISFYRCRLLGRWFVNVRDQANVFINGKQDSISFVRDTLTDAGVGFWVEGNNAGNNYNQKFTIDSCAFINLGVSDVFQPFYIRYTRDLSIRYNTVFKNGCCADILGQIYGVRMPMDFSNNKFFFGNNTAGRGIEFDSLNTINDGNQFANIYNNFFHSNLNGSGTMIRFSRTARTRLVHNNFYSLNTNNQFKVIEINATDPINHVNIEIINNNIFTNGAPALNLLGSSSAVARGNISKINYNNIFRGGNTSNIIYSILGTNYSAASSIPGLIFPGSDSMTIMDVPFSYVSPSDLHLVANNCFWGTYLPAFPVDIDGTTRTNPPTIGAHNRMMTGPGNNLAVTAILQPTIAGFTPGLQNIRALIKNFGNNSVTNFKVGYTVNGSAPKFVSFTGNLAPCDTATVLFTGVNQYNFPAGASFLRVYIDTVNGGRDSIRTNDTLDLTVCSPLAGNYTINPLAPLSATNFQSFTQLTSALNSCGVTAAVNVAVSPGTYTENIVFGNIAGNDTTKMITIDGGNPALVVLKRRTYNASINYVVRFDGTNAITFRNINLQSDSNNVGSLIQAISGVRLRIKRCIIEYTGAAASGTNFAMKAIHISNSYSNTASSNTTYFDVEIDSNIFNNGYDAVDANFNGSFPLMYFRGNIVNNPSGYGIFASGGTYKIIKNVISMRNNGSTANIYIINANSPNINLFNQINENNFPRCGQFGIYMSSTRGGLNTTRKGEIYNNMIGGAFMSSFSNYGIYLQFSDMWNVLHNSISMDSARASGTGVCRGMYFGGGSYYNNTVKNNSISISDIMVANPICVEITNKIYVDTFAGLDNNNYFNAKNKAVLLIGTLNYDSTSFKVAYPNGGGAFSRYGDPVYNGRYDLHTTKPQLDNWAANLGVTRDFDGDLRSATPDVGADEYSSTVTKDMKANNLLQPITTPCFGGSTYTVQGEFKNSGMDSILLTTDTIYTFARVTDPLGGVTLLGPIKYANQVIKKDSLIRPIFSTNFPMSIYGIHKILIYLNWVGDTYTINDSATYNIAVTNPVAVLPTANKTVFCSNDSSRLSAGNSLYVGSYQWVRNGANIPGATDSVYFAKLSGNYYCIVTSPAGCSRNTDSITLTVNPIPSATFTKNKNGFCPGDSVQMNTPGFANHSYQWIWNATNIAGANDTVYFAKNAGSYSVRITNNATSCTNTSAIQTIVAYSNPTAIINPTAGNICNGDSLKLNAVTNVKYTYQWLNNSSNITGARDTVFFAKATGTYQVNIVDTSTGCEALSNIATLTVQTAVSASITSVSKTSFCVGDSAILTCAFVPNSTFQWLKNNVAIPGATDTVLVVKTSGNYAVRLTNTAAGCVVVSSAQTIIANPYPVAFINYSGPNALCFGASLDLKADTTNGAANTYQWMNNGTDITGETNFNLLIGASGVYSVKVTRNGCMTTSSAKTITVEPKIDTTMTITGNLVGCFGNSATLTLPAGPNLNYEWYKNGLITGAKGNSYTANSSGVYYAKIISATSGCNETSRSITIDFAVVKIPNIKSSILTKCQGDSIRLEMGNLDTGIVGYKWIYNSTVISNANDSFVFAKNTGTYVGQIINSRGCVLFTSNLRDLTFNNAVNPTILAGKLNGCEGDTIKLDLNTTVPVTNIAWFKDNVQIPGTTNSIIATATGAFYATVENTNSCTGKSPVVNIKINPNPTPVITQSTSTNELTSSVFSGNQWYMNNSAIVGAKQNTYLPTKSGSYYVTVRDANGCTGKSNEITIAITAIGALTNANIKVYPNPTQDYFIIDFDKNETHEMVIYSSDNKVVFETTLPASEREIRVDAATLAAGAYILKVKEAGIEYAYKLIKQ